MSSQQTNQKFCHHCKKEIPYDTRILRTEACPWCRSDLHVCLNCAHHDTGRNNECLVPNTERVRERDRANHCMEFVFRDGKPPETSAQQKTAESLKSLFKF